MKDDICERCGVYHGASNEVQTRGRLISSTTRRNKALDLGAARGYTTQKEYAIDKNYLCDSCYRNYAISNIMVKALKHIITFSICLFIMYYICIGRGAPLSEIIPCALILHVFLYTAIDHYSFGLFTFITKLLLLPIGLNAFVTFNYYRKPKYKSDKYAFIEDLIDNRVAGKNIDEIIERYSPKPLAFLDSISDSDINKTIIKLQEKDQSFVDYCDYRESEYHSKLPISKNRDEREFEDMRRLEEETNLLKLRLSVPLRYYRSTEEKFNLVKNGLNLVKQKQM